MSLRPAGFAKGDPARKRERIVPEGLKLGTELLSPENFKQRRRIVSSINHSLPFAHAYDVLQLQLAIDGLRLELPYDAFCSIIIIIFIGIGQGRRQPGRLRHRKIGPC